MKHEIGSKLKVTKCITYHKFKIGDYVEVFGYSQCGMYYFARNEYGTEYSLIEEEVILKGRHKNLFKIIGLSFVMATCFILFSLVISYVALR